MSKLTRRARRLLARCTRLGADAADLEAVVEMIEAAETAGPDGLTLADLEVDLPEVFAAGGHLRARVA